MSALRFGLSTERVSSLSIQTRSSVSSRLSLQYGPRVSTGRSHTDSESWWSRNARWPFSVLDEQLGSSRGAVGSSGTSGPARTGGCRGSGSPPARCSSPGRRSRFRRRRRRLGSLPHCLRGSLCRCGQRERQETVSSLRCRSGWRFAWAQRMIWTRSLPPLPRCCDVSRTQNWRSSTTWMSACPSDPSLVSTLKSMVEG